MKGKCLCGEVEFQIIGKLPNMYQCHCSLCQKATGSSSCSSFITRIDGIKWINGKEKISSYTRESGFRSDFCSVCGSPVPNVMNIGNYMWVPAGLLEGVTNSKIAAHIHDNSKASWENNSENVKIFAEGPDSIEKFIKLLYGN